MSLITSGWWSPGCLGCVCFTNQPAVHVRPLTHTSVSMFRLTSARTETNSVTMATNPDQILKCGTQSDLMTCKRRSAHMRATDRVGVAEKRPTGATPTHWGRASAEDVIGVCGDGGHAPSPQHLATEAKHGQVCCSHRVSWFNRCFLSSSSSFLSFKAYMVSHNTWGRRCIRAALDLTWNSSPQEATGGRRSPPDV